MLVLGRKIDDELLLTLKKDLPAGTQIRVKLCGARAGSARIGIDAPEDVSILRAELLEQDNSKVALV